ncbi:alpha/beta fold hydrolase [Pseudodonghicola xiamenensis]|uniref:Hydrolase n=1 Tax=Pseudodonghicola xiamenensis TaxID=337702 RepID=A0A8J3H8E7_9RHOB|nr:alpha/beta fold hydrolase [Pseudodonghicola xiamenensis]GHG90511.1 hydrolase [Pseudodonghicola xiamenensis]
MTEALVLLPGMMCDSRVFTSQINALSRDRAVMVAPITQGERVEEIASALIDVLPQRFALAGLGLGGVVAMEILRRVPDRVRRLCLMATHPLAESPTEAAAREPKIVGARAGRFDEVIAGLIPPDSLAPGAGRITVRAGLRAMAMDLGPEIFVRQSRALQRRRDQQSTLRKYRAPTLILCGGHDGVTPIRRHEVMADLMPAARLEVIESAGHLPPLEAPELTTAALRDWLQAPSGGRA